MSAFFAITLTLLAIFLILLVLVQRGRGGGLAGALGGMGGSSAFGAKAGDTFTRITIVTASIWILLCVAAVYWAGHRGDALSGGGANSPLDRGPGGGAAPVTGPEFPASGKAIGTDAEAPATDLTPAQSAPATSPPAEIAPGAPATPAGNAPSTSTPADSAPSETE